MTVVEEEAIFDATSYDLPIPKIDGIRAKRLTVSFGGALDRTNQEDLEVLGQLEMLQEVTLTVRALVIGKGFAGRPGEDGPNVGYGVRLRVEGFELR